MISIIPFKTRTVPGSENRHWCGFFVKSRAAEKLNINNIKFILILCYQSFVNQKVYILWLDQAKNKQIIIK